MPAPLSEKLADTEVVRRLAQRRRGEMDPPPRAIKAASESLVRCLIGAAIGVGAIVIALRVVWLSGVSWLLLAFVALCLVAALLAGGIIDPKTATDWVRIVFRREKP